VELRGLEPHCRNALTCGKTELPTRNDAKARPATCGYAIGVDGVNGEVAAYPLLLDSQMVVPTT
jgi:hypothetical protein